MIDIPLAEAVRVRNGVRQHKARGRDSRWGEAVVHIMQYDRVNNLWRKRCRRNDFADQPNPLPWETHVTCKSCSE